MLCYLNHFDGTGVRVNEARTLAKVNALIFFQCFDTVGWVTGRTLGQQQKNLPVIPRGSLSIQVEEVTTTIRLMAFFPGQPGQAGTRKANHSGFTGARDDVLAVASAGPYAKQWHLAPDR